MFNSSVENFHSKHKNSMVCLATPFGAMRNSSVLHTINATNHFASR